MGKEKKMKTVVPYFFTLHFPTHVVTCLANSEKPVFPSGFKRYKRQGLLALPVAPGKFQHIHYIFSTIQPGSEVYQM